MRRAKYREQRPDYTPRELEVALNFKYIEHLETLPRHEDAKPDRAEFMRMLEAECKADPIAAMKIVQDYRKAKEQGVYIQDPHGLIKGELGGVDAKHLHTVTGIVNKYGMPQAELREIQRKLKSSDRQNVL